MDKKILFIGTIPNPANKYANVFFQNLIFAMADRGTECHVISPVSITQYKDKIKLIPKETIITTPNGAKVYVRHPRYVSTSAKKIGALNTGLCTKYFYERAVLNTVKKDNTYDAVYGHFFISAGLSAIKVGRKLNIPSFVAYGECDWGSEVERLYRNLKRKDIDGLRGIVSVSRKNTQELNSKGIFKDIPIFTCENAVDLSLFAERDKEECREAFNMPKGKFIVGFVGGFIERKGDKRLLKACEGLDDVYLAFAGKGSEPPKGENVVFCDGIDHERIGEFLEAVDVFALPTLNEGCCNAVLEAMAAGKAIVSSDLPFNDNVLDKTNSIRINPESIEEIRNAILNLKEDLILRKTLSEKAKDDSKNFTIEKRAEKIYNFMFG